MHGEFLVIEDATKMSKSLGNVLTVQSLVDKGIDPMAYRMLVLQSHYRKQLKFSYDTLVSAARGYERLVGMVQRLKQEAKGPRSTKLGPAATARLQAFTEAIASDLNTPQAVAEVYALVEDDKITASEKLTLIERSDAVLGLKLMAEPVAKKSDVPDDMMKLLDARNAARAAKDWPEADRLRKAISDAGWEILDSAAGSTLKRRL
jgi:cysteinyl-tRNA synthetase